MNRILPFSVSLFLLFIGCAGSKPDPVKNKDLPDWVMKPPKLDNKYVGVGSAKRGSFELSKQVSDRSSRGVDPDSDGSADSSSRASIFSVS